MDASSGPASGGDHHPASWAASMANRSPCPAVTGERSPCTAGSSCSPKNRAVTSFAWLEASARRCRRRGRAWAREGLAGHEPAAAVTSENMRRYGVAPASALRGSASPCSHQPAGRVGERGRAPRPGSSGSHARSSPAFVEVGVERPRSSPRKSSHHAGRPQRELAPDEVHGLDAVRALVDRGDAGVAEVLGHARLLDVAHAAVDLDRPAR